MTANRLGHRPRLPYNPGTASSTVATNNLDDLRGCNDDFRISKSALLRVLQGVAEATKTAPEATKPVVQWILSRTGSPRKTRCDCDTDDCNHESHTPALSLSDWCTEIASTIRDDEEDLRQLVSLTVAVAFLREKSRQTQSSSATAAELALVWELIHKALTRQTLDQSFCSAYRSAQGFLAIPLCSLVKDGKINELFRLHVWLPDGCRGYPNFGIHSHQPFAQSWILAGEGKDFSYEVEAVTELETATHAKYSLAWNDGKSQDKSYKTHQVSSKVINTGKLVRTVQTSSSTHTRDMSYSVPAAAFHKSEVSPNILHATLFFFDSHRGFVQDAPVLGPVDGEAVVQVRDAAGFTPKVLADMVDAVRRWEMCMAQALQHVQLGEVEDARREFARALHMCDSVKEFPHTSYYRNIVFSKLENTNDALKPGVQNCAVAEKRTLEVPAPGVATPAG